MELYIITLGQSGPGSNGKEKEHVSLQSSGTDASPPETVLYHTQDTPFG